MRSSSARSARASETVNMPSIATTPCSVSTRYELTKIPEAPAAWAWIAGGGASACRQAVTSAKNEASAKMYFMRSE